MEQINIARNDILSRINETDFSEATSILKTLNEVGNVTEINHNYLNTALTKMQKIANGSLGMNDQERLDAIELYRLLGAWKFLYLGQNKFDNDALIEMNWIISTLETSLHFEAKENCNVAGVFAVKLKQQWETKRVSMDVVFSRDHGPDVTREKGYECYSTKFRTTLAKHFYGIPPTRIFGGIPTQQSTAKFIKDWHDKIQLHLNKGEVPGYLETKAIIASMKRIRDNHKVISDFKYFGIAFIGGAAGVWEKHLDRPQLQHWVNVYHAAPDYDKGMRQDAVRRVFQNCGMPNLAQQHVTFWEQHSRNVSSDRWLKDMRANTPNNKPECRG